MAGGLVRWTPSSWTAAAVVLGVGAGILPLLDPRWALAIMGYGTAVVFGWFLGRGRGVSLVASILLVAVVAAPRMVDRPFPEPSFDPGNSYLVALLAYSMIGLALRVSQTTRERILVLTPALIFLLGCLVVPERLLDPEFGWLSATGGLFVAARHWDVRWGLGITISYVIGVASVLFGIPGVGAGFAEIPLEMGGSGRAFGVFGNPIPAADVIVLLAAALIAIWWARPLAMACILAPGILAVLLTESRTGFLLVACLACFVALGLFPFSSGTSSSRWRLRRGLLVVASGALLMALWLSPSLIGRAGQLSANDATVKVRIVGLQMGANEALRHPFGGGEVRLNVEMADETYENLFFDLAARLGWLPLLGTLLALALAFRLACTASRVSILLLLASGMTAGVYYFPSVWVAGLVGAGVVDRLNRRFESAEDRANQSRSPGVQAVPLAAPSGRSAEGRPWQPADTPPIS